jgi:hypothetical protein
VKDISKKLADQIKSSAYLAQVHKVSGLKGKYVRRDGVIFLVMSIDMKKQKIEVSDAKTAVRQTTKFSIKSFLSKAVEIIK